MFWNKLGSICIFLFKMDSGLDELLNGIQEFREHLGGELTITLISEIGAKHDVHEIDISTMGKAIIWLNEMYKPKVSNSIC